MLDSKVPVIVYVSPPGSRAASAGVFLVMASDVAAMAPFTNIGSSTPISTGGEDIPADLKRKVVNDAAAYIRALAEDHGRNADWAEDAVRVRQQPLRTRGARDERRRLHRADPAGSPRRDRRDARRAKGVVLNTAGAEIETVEMSVWKRILDTIIDPNIIVLLLSLGVLGITVELFNPGLIFPAPSAPSH